MHDPLIGRVLRSLRHRKGWRQADLAAASGVSRSMISELEGGRLDPHSVGTLRAAVQAAGGVLRLTVSVPGGDLERLMDADHATLQDRWKRWLERRGWEVDVEATFSHYGERGSLDLLAWHPVSRSLLVVEVKTVVVDVQALLAGLDRKRRNARRIAGERGWAPVAVVPALIILEASTARRRIAAHASLFGGFNRRGRDATAWLARPGAPAPTGILVLTKLSDDDPGDRRRAGRRRVRVIAPRSRSDRARAATETGPGGA